MKNVTNIDETYNIKKLMSYVSSETVDKKDLIYCHKIIPLLLIALCFKCFSQHKFSESLGFGVSLVRHNPKDVGPGIEMNNKFGNSFTIGLGYKYQFKKLIGLGIDLSVAHITGTQLSERNGTATWLSSPVTYTREEENGFKFNYITIPAYINIYYKRFSFDFGMQGSYAFSREYSYTDKFMYSNGSTTNTGVQFTGNNSFLQKYDYGLFTALNVNVSKKLNVFIRYYKGLQNLWEDSGSDLKNVQIIIGARYNFFVSTAKNNVPEKATNIKN